MQQQKLTQTLKIMLKSRNKTYNDVSKWLKLSESSVKRLFSKETLTLSQMEVLCRKLTIDFVELVQTANANNRQPVVLSRSQEEELVSEPELFRLFYLLFRKWTVPQISAAFSMTEPSMVKLLLRLERLGLIELRPEQRVKLLVSPHLKWIPSGPVAQFFRKDVTRSFLEECSDTNPEHLLLFIPCELSREGAKRIRASLSAAAREIQEITELEAKLSKESSVGHGILFAMRPWVHPLFLQRQDG